jgi:hypothetical protein
MIIFPLSFIADILLLVVGASNKYKYTGSTRFAA